MLQTAEQQAQESTDSNAVKMALTMSQGAQDDKDYLRAYEVLYALTPSQRKMPQVAEQLETLKDRYVSQALKQAADLQHTYTSIKNLSDERAVRRAYNLYSNCYAITEEQNLREHIRSLADDLSDYYLTRAKHFVGLSSGTGVNVGWNYLVEALQLSPSNISDIHAEMNAAKAAHDLRSGLSISVIFSDQTATSEGTNFSDRLTNFLATGLENHSSENVKVVRPHESPGVPPNFALIGEVVQNTASVTVGERNTKSSMYRTEQELINPAWSAANRVYENANLSLQTAQQALSGAEAGHKKKQIEDARRQAEDAQKKVEEARDKRDALQKSSPQETGLAYNYTEQVHHFTANVEVRFVIKNTTGTAVGPPVPVIGKPEKTYTKTEGVKDADTMGVHDSEVPTPAQFLGEADNEVSGDVLKQAKEAVAGLPAVVLKAADNDVAEGDNDGAAEQYMLYLNSTEGAETPERKRAQKFLLETFNFQAYGESAPQT